MTDSSVTFINTDGDPYEIASWLEAGKHYLKQVVCTADGTKVDTGNPLPVSAMSAAGLVLTPSYAEFTDGVFDCIAGNLYSDGGTQLDGMTGELVTAGGLHRVEFSCPNIFARWFHDFEVDATGGTFDLTVNGETFVVDFDAGDSAPGREALGLQIQNAPGIDRRVYVDPTVGGFAFHWVTDIPPVVEVDGANLTGGASTVVMAGSSGSPDPDMASSGWPRVAMQVTGLDGDGNYHIFGTIPLPLRRDGVPVHFSGFCELPAGTYTVTASFGGEFCNPLIQFTTQEAVELYAGPPSYTTRAALRLLISPIAELA